MIDRISIEVTHLCAKACWFCYNGSDPAGDTTWTVDELVSFGRDCAQNGVKAVSLGGGEPLSFPGLFDVFAGLQGHCFRSMTTNGLLLDANFDRVIAAAPDKVHVSIHFPHRTPEVDRVVRQVTALKEAGIPSGVNLLVAQPQLDAAVAAAQRLRDEGIGNERIVYLPMRMRGQTPTPEEVARVAGGWKFQSMTCLLGCGKSPRFVSIGWDKRVAWCSYTTSRRTLTEPTFQAMTEAIRDLDLAYCG